jgi:hypothetical protein
MSLVAVLTMLIATAPEAEEMRDLEADMASGHEAVVENENENANESQSVQSEQPASPQVTTIADSESRPMHREGFTFELGLGIGGTNDYVDPGRRIASVFAASIGGFFDDRTALLLHFAGSGNSHTDPVTISGQDADRYHTINSFFLGPQVQWFPIDRLMLAFGVGGVARLDSVRVDIHGTTTGDTAGVKGSGGVGASARAAFTVYQRKDAAALRIGVEALPSYVQGNWHTSVAFMAELQSF